MIQIGSAGKRKALRGAGVLVAVTVLVAGLAAPASAHHGGGCRGNSSRSTTVYCQVCETNHTRGDCPNACGTCGYSHTGDCYSGGGHHGGGHH